MKYSSYLSLGVSVLLSSPLFAVINLGGLNDYNTTDPATGVPWDAVARVADYDGSVVTSPRGSALYLGDGYVLTAHHVNVNINTWISFDGASWWQRDTSFAAQQVSPNVDMKVFKLLGMPTITPVKIYEGASEFVAPATLIGWGRGRDATPITANSVPWGDDTTIDKRWGENVPRVVVNLPYQSGSYQAIMTVLGADDGTPVGLGADEASATLYDSGSGLFQFLDSEWQLIGLTTAVTQNGIANFGDDIYSFDPTNGEGDWNSFVRVSTYADDIATLIPEPNVFSLLLGLGALAVVGCRRYRRGFTCEDRRAKGAHCDTVFTSESTERRSRHVY